MAKKIDAVHAKADDIIRSAAADDAKGGTLRENALPTAARAVVKFSGEGVADYAWPEDWKGRLRAPPGETNTPGHYVAGLYAEAAMAESEDWTPSVSTDLASAFNTFSRLGQVLGGEDGVAFLTTVVETMPKVKNKNDAGKNRFKAMMRCASYAAKAGKALSEREIKAALTATETAEKTDAQKFAKKVSAFNETDEALIGKEGVAALQVLKAIATRLLKAEEATEAEAEAEAKPATRKTTGRRPMTGKAKRIAKARKVAEAA